MPLILEAQKSGVVPRPYRTGGIWVLTPDFVVRSFDKETSAQLLMQRWAFIPDEACVKLGLIVEGKKNRWIRRSR